MKQFNISLDISLDKMSTAERKFVEEQGHAGIFESLLLQGLQSIYPNGMPISKSKLVARIQKSIESLDKTATIFSAEESEFELIKDVFTGDGARFQASQSRAVLSMIENLEKAYSV